MPFLKEVLILRDFHQDIHSFPFLQLISIVKNIHYAGRRNASSRFPKERLVAQVLSDVCAAFCCQFGQPLLQLGGLARPPEGAHI